ncbi:MAG: hypothetical protein U1F83_06445 [Verrucomicrobiota bacterium]
MEHHEKTVTRPLLTLVCAFASSAAIQTKKVEYKQGITTLEGVLVYDDAVKTKRPGVLVVHQWMGPHGL